MGAIIPPVADNSLEDRDEPRAAAFNVGWTFTRALSPDLLQLCVKKSEGPVARSSRCRCRKANGIDVSNSPSKVVNHRA